MDKIFSTRISEATIHRISDLANRLQTSKKAIVEGAIHLLAKKVEDENGTDIFAQTSGAWNRAETIDDTISQAKNTFRNSLRRYQK